MPYVLIENKTGHSRKEVLDLEVGKLILDKIQFEGQNVKECKRLLLKILNYMIKITTIISRNTYRMIYLLF